MKLNGKNTFILPTKSSDKKKEYDRRLQITSLTLLKAPRLAKQCALDRVENKSESLRLDVVCRRELVERALHNFSRTFWVAKNCA